MSNICIFGDSIVQGVYGESAPSWADLVKQRFNETKNLSASTFGIAGDDTRGLLKRLPSTLEVAHECAASGGGVRTVVIAIGTNDAREYLEESGTFEFRLPVEEFETNLASLLRECRRYTDGVVMVGLLRANEEKSTKNSKRFGTVTRHSEAALRQYDGVVRRFCECENLRYVPILEAVTPEDFPDGVHPTAAAHARIADLVYEKLITRA